jgi:hypothetical protein
MGTITITNASHHKILRESSIFKEARTFVASRAGRDVLYHRVSRYPRPLGHVSRFTPPFIASSAKHAFQNCRQRQLTCPAQSGKIIVFPANLHHGTKI